MRPNILFNQPKWQQSSHQLSERNEYTSTETTAVQTEKYQRGKYLTIHPPLTAEPDAENTVLLRR